MTTSPTYEIVSETALDQSRYVFPASFAQQRLWFLDQLEPQNVAYNIPASIYLKVALDVGALEQSIIALIQRHEILRTTFAAVDGQPMQMIVPSFKVPLPLVDLSAFPETTQRWAEVLRLANEEVQRPFDLAQGPLLRT